MQIPYGRQNINEDDIQAVVNILRSEYLTQGPAVPAFERALADYCGIAEAIAVNSATSALHLACLALNVGPGDLVWTTPVSFVATANCALYCGAQVDFVDIDPSTNNLSIRALTAKLEEAKKNGLLPKVVIPVHLSGLPCEMEPIYNLGQYYGFKIIEDASHAIGGQYQGEPVGNCRYSDITVFSFHPVKIITSGEGGAALTRHEHLATKMRRLRSHGITREAREMIHPPDGPWYYEQIDLGYNYRMTDIQAALGLSQMSRLDQFVEKRHAIAEQYAMLLKELPVTVPIRQTPVSVSSLHLYIIRLQLDVIDRTHKEIFEIMRAAEIGVNLHYIPIYRQPYFQTMDFQHQLFPQAEQYYAEAITLPLYPESSNAQQQHIVTVLIRGPAQA